MCVPARVPDGSGPHVVFGATESGNLYVAQDARLLSVGAGATAVPAPGPDYDI